MESNSQDDDLPKTGSKEGLRGKRLLGLGRFPPEASLGRTVKVSVNSLHPISGYEHEELTILASLHMASTRKIAEDALLHSLGMYVTYPHSLSRLSLPTHCSHH